jgi:hypothetical protein
MNDALLVGADSLWPTEITKSIRKAAKLLSKGQSWAPETQKKQAQLLLLFL